jgi:pyruvate/2-oxoglutarate dehydrogenase complex dihydrolipoamide dehydrogenase (E3) component
MAVDYNLVIVGGSLTARYAAAFARCFESRVALVEPAAFQTSYAGIDKDRAIALSLLLASQHRAIAPVESAQAGASLSDATLVLEKECSLTASPAFTQWLWEYSLDSLAARGVDVIITRNGPPAGEFCRRPHLGVVADGRVLRSHAYLLAPGSTPTLPFIPSLSAVPYLTLDSLWRRSLRRDSTLAILGQSPRGIEVAQALAQLGMAVTLLIESPQFLPDEDREVAQWTMALLESLGVTIVTGAKVNDIKSVHDTVLLQISQPEIDRPISITVDHLVLATPHRAEISTLNLDAANVRAVNSLIPVSRTFRTSNSRVYACGTAIAPLHHPAIARYQAECAVKNALFLPTRRMGDRPFASVIHTLPPCGYVGLTESQARNRYPGKIIELTLPLHTEMPDAMDINFGGSQAASFITVTVHHNGTILGASCASQATEELLAICSLAIDQRWSIEQLTSVTPSMFRTASPHTLGLCETIFHRLLIQWESQRIAHNQARRNLLELLMNWQRDWSRG